MTGMPFRASSSIITLQATVFPLQEDPKQAKCLCSTFVESSKVPSAVLPNCKLIIKALLLFIHLLILYHQILQMGPLFSTLFPHLEKYVYF